MFATKLVCRACGELFPLENLYNCPKCGGILEVKYDETRAFAGSPVLHPDLSQSGMWKYKALLPVQKPENIVTLGEGDTPLLRADRAGANWNSRLNLYVKAEMLNPSGSFKDRPTSVAVSVAKEKGYQKIVVASSGNASAAAAAYAARAGMECVVFVPRSTDPNKVTQAQSYGANVYCVEGNYSRSFDMAVACAATYGWANVTSTFINPYTVEGDKVPAYELYHQLPGHVPDAVLIPIGSGPLLVGMYKGFIELKKMGLIKKLPKMIGVQPDQCKPITEAYENGLDRVCGWQHEINTIAGGISDPLIGYEKDGELTLKTVRQSGGSMISLNENEILEANQLVEKKIGLYCEPTGAVSLGAIKKMETMGMLKPGETVVAFLTGHGFKFSKRGSVPLEAISSIQQLASTEKE